MTINDILFSMEIFVLILGLILGLGSLAYMIYFLRTYCKNRLLKELDKSTLIKLVVPVAIFVISSPITFLGIALSAKLGLDGLHYFLLILGAMLFGAGFGVFTTCFVLRYYKTNLENENIKKWISRAMFIAIPVFAIGFLMFMEGYGPYLSYPLVNKISFFSDDGIIHFYTPDESSSKGLSIAFYGVFIVSGAVLVYFICDHKFYQVYKKHGLLDTCFLVAFPMGIVGARLWFCLVLKTDYYVAHPAEIIRIWDGGLAIMGGAILGIISGVSFLLLFRRYINIRQAMDIIVPCILIAQGVGRWGNFFNQEVYGNPVNPANWWFIPTFVRNNMINACGDSDGNMYVPLFLIESVTNICGYFIIVYGIGKPLKKYLPLGSRAGLYLSWYGSTRVIMEPLRFGSSGSVDKFDNSWYSAFALLGGGLLLIAAFHLYEVIMKKNYKKTFEAEKDVL